MSAAAPPHRLSSGVVVVSLVQRKLKYLLLRAYRNWDFPKGLVEAGEQPLDAALREVREETTLEDLSFDWGLEFMDTGPYNKGKISRYYMARSKRLGGAAADQSGSWQCRSTTRRAGSDLTRALAMVSPRLQPVVQWARIPSSITQPAQSR